MAVFFVLIGVLFIGLKGAKYELVCTGVMRLVYIGVFCRLKKMSEFDYYFSIIFLVKFF